VIGVTGSVGKTSTKEMLRALMLARQGTVHAAEASFNNHWGVPLTLARMPRRRRFRGDRDRHEPSGRDRAAGAPARPHVALITTIAPAHLEALRSARGDRARKGRHLRGAGAGRRRGAGNAIATAPILLRRGWPGGRRARRLRRRAARALADPVRAGAEATVARPRRGAPVLLKLPTRGGISR
jgi:UDP-N-acetylmuramoyl-tripeptide--D-alanyl-D-alanine ligase